MLTPLSLERTLDTPPIFLNIFSNQNIVSNELRNFVNILSLVGSKFSGFRENLWICRKHSPVIISTHGPSLLTVTAHLHGRGKKSTFAFTRNTHSHLQEIYICVYKKSTFTFTFNRTHLHPSVSVFGSRHVIVDFFSAKYGKPRK